MGTVMFLDTDDSPLPLRRLQQWYQIQHACARVLTARCPKGCRAARGIIAAARHRCRPTEGVLSRHECARHRVANCNGDSLECERRRAGRRARALTHDRGEQGCRAVDEYLTRRTRGYWRRWERCRKGDNVVNTV